MAKLPIVIYPDGKLWTVSRYVSTKELGDLQTFMDDMWETLEAADGVGMSAIQVGVAKRIILLRIDGKRETYINPLLAWSGEKDLVPEGCLSLPGIFDKAWRFPNVSYMALNEKGEEIRGDTDGLRAQALQHEFDHLDGRIFVDRLTKQRRNEIRVIFSRIHKQAKALKCTPSEFCYGW